MRLKIADEPLYNLQQIYKENEFFKQPEKQKILAKYLPTKFRMSDLEAAIAKLKAETDSPEDEEKFEYGFDVYTGSMQKFLTDRPNFVVQLNLKPNYMGQMFSKMGNDFKEWYLKIAKAMHNSAHPVFPIPGHTIAWARVHELEPDTWLINEVQEDWGTVKATAKQIAQGQMNTMIDGEGNMIPIPDKIKDLITQPEHLEWLEYITGDILVDYEKIVMRAVLDLARENGVKHIYMLPHTIQNHIPGQNKRKILYDELPKKFHFNKVKVDLHDKYEVNETYLTRKDKDGKDVKVNPEYYWYRTAKRKESNFQTMWYFNYDDAKAKVMAKRAGLKKKANIETAIKNHIRSVQRGAANGKFNASVIIPGTPFTLSIQAGNGWHGKPDDVNLPTLAGYDSYEIAFINNDKNFDFAHLFDESDALKRFQSNDVSSKMVIYGYVEEDAIPYYVKAYQKAWAEYQKKVSAGVDGKTEF